VSAAFSTTVAFPNGLLWLMSEDAKELFIPDIDGVANFWSSSNTRGVTVQHDADGEVEVSISGDPPTNPALALLHEGVLHSSRQLIDVETVHIDRIGSFRASSTDARISIWGDDPGQPGQVHIQCHNIEGEVST
jgi:hypothetical protein